MSVWDNGISYSPWPSIAVQTEAILILTVLPQLLQLLHKWINCECFLQCTSNPIYKGENNKWLSNKMLSSDFACRKFKGCSQRYFPASSKATWNINLTFCMYSLNAHTLHALSLLYILDAEVLAASSPTSDAVLWQSELSFCKDIDLG